MNLDDYNYFLPDKNLALEPAVPRDSSKLFIYIVRTNKIIFDQFSNVDKYLPKDSFMVMNNTKVLPARVTMKKENGGKVVILFLVNELGVKRYGSGGETIKVLADRKIVVGDKIYFDDKYFLKVVNQSENIFELECDFSREHLFDLLKKYGTMPIPPYLKKSSLSKDDLIKKYQTIFARVPDGTRLASAAAPTASLHFTDSVFKKLDKNGIERLFVTLHIGLGTFAPITDENIQQKKLHNEYYEVDLRMYQSINRLKQGGKKLVAVGTTVVRTLESEARNDSVSRFLSHESLSPSGPLSKVKKSPLPRHAFVDKTDLFIFPPYDFKMVDVMITNFHLPKSSLMMLVEAFLQHKGAKRNLVELYNIAIKNNFRFYSFGDVMAIL